MTIEDRAPPRAGGEGRRVFWHTEVEAGRVRPLPPLFRWTADGRRVRLRPDSPPAW